MQQSVIYQEWREEFLQEGRREGRQEGRQAEGQVLILRQLTRCLGEMTPELQAQVSSPIAAAA
jgi:predicted transposase YdaD